MPKHLKNGKSIPRNIPSEVHMMCHPIFVDLLQTRRILDFKNHGRILTGVLVTFLRSDLYDTSDHSSFHQASLFHPFSKTDTT
jgi:hypothetical protein